MQEINEKKGKRKAIMQVKMIEICKEKKMEEWKTNKARPKKGRDKARMEARKEARKQIMKNAIVKENNKEYNKAKRKETRKNREHKGRMK